MITAPPIADAERGAVAGESAEGGGSTYGAAGVGADAGEGGAFLDGRGCAAGGASGEEGGIDGLEAVAVVAVFAGDAVGELVEMGFADDDGARASEAGGDPGVCGCVRFLDRVEFGATAGRESGEVETIFE